MLIPILVAEYKYNDNIIEINLKDKKDCILRKYVYEYNKDNLINNCKIYINKYDGSYNYINIRFDRDNNITKVFKNSLLADEIIKNNNEYEINTYLYKDKYDYFDRTNIIFFNDHIDKYLYSNIDKKYVLEESSTTYFDKNNRFIKTMSNIKDTDELKISYEYDDKNRIIKKIIKVYEKDTTYMETTTETFKYDEYSNKSIYNVNIKCNTDIPINRTNYLEIYTPNMLEHRNFNTLESQQLLSKYGYFFLIYTDYIILNPDNIDVGDNFKYDNQSRVISKEILLTDLSMK